MEEELFTHTPQTVEEIKNSYKKAKENNINYAVYAIELAVKYRNSALIDTQFLIGIVKNHYKNMNDKLKTKLRNLIK